MDFIKALIEENNGVSNKSSSSNVIGTGETDPSAALTLPPPVIHSEVASVPVAENKCGILLYGGSLDFDSMTSKQPEGLSTYLRIDLGLPVKATFSSSSSMHLFILVEDGRLFAMGSNSCGQLGLNDLETRKQPTLVEISLPSAITKVACGRFHSILLLANGEIWGSGLNKNGQLGLGDGKAFSGNIKTFTKMNIIYTIIL